MRCQGDWLGLLKMGETRHEGVCILLHNRQQLFQQFLHQRFDGVNLIPGIELHVQGYLIIAAASCVKAFSRLPNRLRQGTLYKGVDILISGIG